MVLHIRCGKLSKGTVSSALARAKLNLSEMHSTFFIVASLALLAFCVCAPAEQDVIQHIPTKAEQTPSAIGSEGAVSGASGKAVGSAEHQSRARREVAGQESDLLPSGNDVEVSPFGEVSNLEGRGRIRVLPAYLG